MRLVDNAGGNTILRKGRYLLETRPIFRLVPNRYPPINVSGHRGQQTNRVGRKREMMAEKYEDERQNKR